MKLRQKFRQPFYTHQSQFSPAGSVRWPSWHSPNHNARPAGAAAHNVDTIVIHNISLPPNDVSGRWVRALFTNQLPASYHPYFAPIAKVRVSAHFYIARKGRVVQCVPLHRRAWHAGASTMRTDIPTDSGMRDNVNNHSIGIELAGTDDTAFTPAQYAALVRVLRAVCAQYPIRYILGHSDIAPGRKTDPGDGFDWAMLKRMLPNSMSLRWRNDW